MELDFGETQQNANSNLSPRSHQSHQREMDHQREVAQRETYRQRKQSEKHETTEEVRNLRTLLNNLISHYVCISITGE